MYKAEGVLSTLRVGKKKSVQARHEIVENAKLTKEDSNHLSELLKTSTNMARLGHKTAEEGKRLAEDMRKYGIFVKQHDVMGKNVLGTCLLSSYFSRSCLPCAYVISFVSRFASNR